MVFVIHNKNIFLMFMVLLSINSCNHYEVKSISSPKIQNIIQKHYINPKKSLDTYSNLLDYNQSKRLRQSLESLDEKALFTLMLENKLLYVRIKKFNQNIDLLLREVLFKYYRDTKGIIIDLRDNPGGLLLKAICISNFFVNNGVLLKTVGKNKNDIDIYYAKKSHLISRVPIVIIVNERSISASEVLAGILQDKNRAIVIGRKTYGKGNIQDLISVSRDRILKLTTGKYYFSSGKSIDNIGILPDIEIQEKKIVIHKTLASSLRYDIMKLKIKNRDLNLLVAKMLLLY